MDPTKRQVAASQVHLMVIINEVYLMGKIFKLYTSMTNIHKVLKPFYAYYFKYEVDVWIENGNVLFTVRNFVVDIISSKYVCVCVLQGKLALGRINYGLNLHMKGIYHTSHCGFINDHV